MWKVYLGTRSCVVNSDKGVNVPSMLKNPSIAAHVRIRQLGEETPADEVAQARDLLLEYGRFVVAQPGTARFCFGSLEKEAADLPDGYLKQGGGCLAAFANGEPAGFVAWRMAPPQAAPEAWEMKRLWVRPQHRRLHLGQALIQAVIDRARLAGRSAIFLDTAPASMAAAYRLYLALGFRPCAPYNDNPVQGLAYLSLRL